MGGGGKIWIDILTLDLSPDFTALPQHPFGYKLGTSSTPPKKKKKLKIGRIVYTAWKVTVSMQELRQSSFHVKPFFLDDFFYQNMTTTYVNAVIF